MTIKSSETFTFNGISSANYNIYNVQINTSGGLVEEPFMAPAIIYQVSTRHNEKPFFQRIKREVLVFNLSFGIEEWTDDDTLKEIAYWLGGPTTYKELTFSDLPNRIFFALHSGPSRLFHAGLRKGYIDNFEFRTNSPFAFSNLIERTV